MVAGGRLKRTKRFTIKSLRGKKEKREKEEMEGKRGKKGCRRILFVAIVSRGEKRLIYGRVGNLRENHYLYFPVPVANIPFPRAVQTKSVRASVCVEKKLISEK